MTPTSKLLAHFGQTTHGIELSNLKTTAISHPKMLLRTELTLRTAAMGCRLQPSISTPCNYHTTRPSRFTQDASPSRRRTPLIKSSPSQSIVRYTSTVQSPNTTTNSTTASSSPAAPASNDRLDWNTFFALRKSRRRLQLGSSIGTSLVSMVGGAQGLAMSDMDAIVAQIPLDPFITLGLITFGCGGVGWLLGPIVGTGIFNTMNRKYTGQMAVVRGIFII